eukprot:UN02964
MALNISLTISNASETSCIGSSLSLVYMSEHRQRNSLKVTFSSYLSRFVFPEYFRSFNMAGTFSFFQRPSFYFPG